MKKVILGALVTVSVLTVGLNAKMPTAKESRAVTEFETQKAYDRLIKSEKGKLAYDGIMGIFEKNIKQISKDGFYDTFSITYMNSNHMGHMHWLKKLTKAEQNLMRKKIINDLKVLGYKVGYNKFWNNPDALNISVTW